MSGTPEIGKAASRVMDPEDSEIQELAGLVKNGNMTAVKTLRDKINKELLPGKFNSTMVGLLPAADKHHSFP